MKATSRKAEGVEGYKIDYARDQDAFPDPKWPTRTLDELLEVTFRNANIDTDNHPGSAPPDRREAGSDVTAARRCFRTIVVVDFEYEIDDGDLPRVLCMVAYVLDANLRHVGTIRLWRGEFGSTPPFDIGPDTLVVGYSLWAEMTCFLVLGWRFPVHVYDLHTAYLATSNILLPYDPDEVRKKPRKRLSDACRAYGIEGWENIDKPEMAKAIGEGRWREYGREAVLQYCEEDVRASAELLRRQLTGHGNRAPVDPELRHALEQLQRQDRRPDPGPRHADRHAAVESRAGEQAGGHRRADPAVRSRARAARTRSTPRTASGATTGSRIGWRPPASRNGRDWTPARSSWTATRSA